MLNFITGVVVGVLGWLLLNGDLIFGWIIVSICRGDV